jgi:hypothetical protein
MLREAVGTKAPATGDATLTVLPGTPTMLTQNVNLPRGTFPIVTLPDLQDLPMEPLTNSTDLQNTPIPSTIRSLLQNTFPQR